ncbi:MAG: hypothetical protein HYX54_00265 [Chloroflexi bacterium]|nr:hypothetical protein [Chloroflexota bacterium]
MQNRAEPACLIIADIAGYTGYMAGVELDHAQDILADLMGTVEAMGGISRALPEELEHRAAEAEPEPELPTTSARFLTQPVAKAGSARSAMGSVDSAPSNSSSG